MTLMSLQTDIPCGRPLSISVERQMALYAKTGFMQCCAALTFARHCRFNHVIMMAAWREVLNLLETYGSSRDALKNFCRITVNFDMLISNNYCSLVLNYLNVLSRKLHARITVMRQTYDSIVYPLTNILLQVMWKSYSENWMRIRLIHQTMKKIPVKFSKLLANFTDICEVRSKTSCYINLRLTK